VPPPIFRPRTATIVMQRVGETAHWSQDLTAAKQFLLTWRLGVFNSDMVHSNRK